MLPLTVGTLTDASATSPGWNFTWNSSNPAFSGWIPNIPRTIWLPGVLPHGWDQVILLLFAGSQASVVIVAPRSSITCFQLLVPSEVIRSMATFPAPALYSPSRRNQEPYTLVLISPWLLI